jgi:hypothetical protein
MTIHVCGRQVNPLALVRWLLPALTSQCQGMRYRAACKLVQAQVYEPYGHGGHTEATMLLGLVASV